MVFIYDALYIVQAGSIMVCPKAAMGRFIGNGIFDFQKQIPFYLFSAQDNKAVFWFRNLGCGMNGIIQ